MATTLTIGASPEEPALTSPPPGIDPQPEIASSAFNASPIPDLPEVDPVLNEVVKSNDPIADKVKMLDLWRDDVLRASKLSDDYSAKKDAIIKLADEDVNVARGALMKNHFEQKAREAFPTIESRDRFMRDFNKYGLNADAYPDGLSTNPMHKEFIQGIKDDSDKLFGNGKASWDLNLATDAGFEILRGKAHETGDGKTLVTGQMRDAPPDGNNAIDGGSPLAALLTGKSADTFLADPKDSKGWNTYNPTFEVDTATPEDIKTETDKVQAELDGIPAKRAELERISRETIEASKSQPFVEGGGMTISPLAVMERQAAELAIKEKSLKTRLANLEKSGKAFLTNERIAAHIRNTPELMSLIPDKGVITRILNGAENMVMDFNVVGEQVGLPWMKGSLAGAAEAKTLKGQIGTGMEQSEFAGDPWSRIKLGVADNAAQTAMQLGLGGSSSEALTYGSMWLSSYGQALTQAEQQIQALRLSGDFEGARKAEENKQLFAIGTAVNDTAWEMAGGPASSMMLGKKALARPFLHAAIDPFVEAGEEIGTSITGAGLGLNNLIGQSSGIQGSDLVVAGFTAMGSAGFQAGISRKLRHLASAPAQMTPEQQAKNEILERVIKEMGVTGNITPPNVKSQRADTENPTTSTMGPDGKITVNLNPMWVHQPEGSQNWTIQDDGIRQRAFQAGLKTDFPTKEEADAFAQTVHQHIFEASVDGQVGDAITQDQVNAQKTLVQSAFQSVINKRPELRMDDLYSRFLIAMEGVQSNKVSQPAASSAPRVGQDVSFKSEGAVHRGKYLGPVASVPGMSRVQVGDKVMDARNGSIAENTPGVTLFQYAGEKAKMPQFMRDSLKAAEAMAASGKSSEEIRSVTGWFPGKYDGKMRWEIPDNDASLTKGGLFAKAARAIEGGDTSEQFVGNLSDVLEHDKLFEAYPEAKNINVFLVPGMNSDGEFSKGNPQLGLSPTIRISASSDPSKAKSTILHEVQHWIQEKEGFAKGGSPSNIVTPSNFSEALEFKDAERGLKKYSAEFTRLTEALKGEQEKKKTLGFGGPNKSRVAELESAINAAAKSIEAIWSHQGKKNGASKGSAKAAILRAINSVEAEMGSAWAIGRETKNAGLVKIYKLLAGEIEARDVEARSNMSPDELAATAPYSSENIAPEDAIVMFESGTSQSSSSQETGNTVKGRVDTPLGNLGHAVIALTSSHDGSTLLHEFIHGLGNLEIATGNGKTESLLQVILGDKSNAFHAWAMEGSEKMTDPVEAFRHTHERIAEGFEEWLRTGALPSHKNKGMLRQAFETIRDAMKQIVGDMIGRGIDRRYIPIGTKLPAAALEGYESLFALLDSDNNGKEQNPQPTLGIWDHVKSNSETSEANLYPLTKRGEYGREPLSAAELEYLARNNGLIGPDATNDEAAAVVADLAAQATRNAAAFNQGITLNQSENEVVAADKAKQLIDIATAKLMFMQSVKNDGKVPTLEQWKADLAKTGSHVFDGLSDAAMSLIYQGATMNISSTQANNVRALIQSAMLGANETVTLNEKDEYVRAITEAASMVKPGAKRAMQLNAKRASEATSAAQLNAAMNSALKIVGGEARVETRMQSERLRGLMAGYRAGNKSASQLKAILAEMKSMMLPVIKSSDVGASTKSFVNAVINVLDSATKGFDPSSILNTLDQAVVAIDKIGFDKANAAKANFTRGLKIGQRTQAARSEAVAKVLIDELKTVDGITPNEAARVVKMIRDAKTDLQLNRSVWKALLLFQDKRVAQAYDLATTRQEGIKRNLNQGKFGRLSDDVRKFAAFEAWHIPQHMLSQFSTLAGVLASNEAVISLDGVRTQVATQNQQIEAWLEANPPEETVRAPSDAMAKAFDEAMERFNIERDFDEAKNAMDRDKFIASLRELGESEEGAEEAARIQEHWKNFELFKNADKLDLLSLNNREMRGLVNSFRNYNAGIITGFIGRKAAEYRQKQFEEPFVSVLASGLRHIMKLDADKKLDVQGDFDRSVSIVDHTKRLAGWFFGFDRLSRTKIAQSKIGFTGSIEQQIRESGIYNLDSLFETQQWINRNITKQYTDMQADGIFNRMRILNIKDSAGKTIADYHLGFDNVSHYEGDHVTGNPALRKAYQQQFMPGNLNLGAGWNVVAKTPLGIGEKLSNIKNRRNQRMSRWIGFAMMQRQREANGMDGNYVDYVIGEKQHVRTGALDDRAGQIDDAKALMEVMKAAGVVSAPTFKQIAAILPADAHAAIALADRIFDHTGQWTYYLNQLEREAPLPMPVNYFPIQSYEDNASVEASMGSLGFELRGGVVEGQPDNMRAAARHARLNTKLKMANVNFFNVVESSVGKAAADMAATPVLKMVNNSFGEFKRKGLFTGASHNVAEEVRKAMLESGLRLAHPILGDAGVSHTIRGLVSQLLAQKSLAQAMRPLREVVGNMATNVLAGKFPATYRGWTARNVPGGNQFWDKLMVDLKAPTAMRSGPEAVNGIMQDMTLGIEDMLNHEHIPGFFAEIGKEIRHKRPQERSLIGRLQSHLLARVSRAAIKGLVTAGENPIIWPQWTGHFMDSIKDQTGAEFDRAKYEAGGYTADQLSIAVTTSEKGISDFMAQSARGGGRLAAMVPLNIDQRNAFLNSMMYQLTSFIGAQSNASRFAYKALARSPVGSQASNKAIATIGGLLVGNMVVNSAGTILAQAMKAGLDLGKIDFGGDDEEEKARRRAKSLAIHEFEETRDNALFLNGAREGANFWAVMGLRSMFSLRFGGASAIARLGAATALETAWMMAGDVQDYLTERGVPAGGWKERGGYNPYRDNVTFESTAWAAAFAYKRIAPFVPFISMDEKVDRAWQSSNALSVATTFGPTNALLSTLADMSRDVGNVMDGSLGRAGSAADFLLNSLMIANAFPIYPTVRPFTNEAAKNETIGNESFKETIFDKRAEQAGRAYAENPTKENEKRLAALPPDSMPIANRWIEKTMILNNASTVPGEPAKSRMLAHSLHSIESYKEKERHIELTNQYYKMKKAGVRGEFVNAIQQLRDSGKWGDTFGSKGDSSDFAQEMLKYDRETQRGEVPLEAYGSFY